MRTLFIRLFMAINKLIFQISRGKIGQKLGSQSILLLHTYGRKTGKERIIPIAYFVKENKIIIVASNWGKENQAAWYLNVSKNHHAILELNSKQLKVFAHEAVGEEYDILWQYVTEKHPPYLDYQKMTSRRIPIMIFDEEK
jgi:F420H(2)-dependent quinone reductase